MRVDAVAVDQELSRLQRELTNSDVRTSLFNLVVMSPDAERAMVDEALTYILGKRAARVIHVVSTDAAESSLEVSARCFIDHEKRGVCFEEVIITNGTDGAGGAPGSWTPLLIRDIPTFVLWLDRVSGNEELFRHAQNQSDKVIVDGDLSVERGDTAVALIRHLAESARDTSAPLIDFSWKRLLPARKLLADAFDAHPGRSNEIARVEARGLAPMSGELLRLWLSERLGWKSVPGGGMVDLCDRTVEVSVAREADDCFLGLSVTLHDGTEISLTTGVDGCTDVDSPEGASSRVLHLPSNGEILLEEVDAVSADGYYVAALLQSLELYETDAKQR